MRFSTEIITSKQNPTVIAVGKLDDRKTREKTGLFRFDGMKLFREATANHAEIEKILLRESDAERLVPLVRTTGEGGNADAGTGAEPTVLVLADPVFDKLTSEQAPEGIITVARIPKTPENPSDLLADAAADRNRRIFLLESVRDPGNVGTILRSAAAFGVGLLVLSRDCADLYNPKTVRGAMGALFRLPVLVTDDLPQAVGILRRAGRRVFAAALDRNAAALGSFPLVKSDCVIVGNEGHGLSEPVLHACDRTLYIPMEPGCESLNAAIAASVILWSLYSGQ